ncbi:substrate-binding domain-containing protein [Kitasatospora sp. NPDC001119]
MRRAMTMLGGAAAIAVLATTTVGGTALADPAAGVTPRAVDVVGVGDGATQILMNRIASGYNASLTDPATPRLYSWDTRPSGTITTKSGATTIARPADQHAGMVALNGRTGTTVDFARASRGPQQDDLSTDDFVAIAWDAVAWAAPATGNAPANLSTGNLKDIYTCAVTTWNQIDPALPNATIKAYLPPSGTGLRAHFLLTIGRGYAVTPGACVTSGIRENQGSDPLLADPDALIPYSTGYYIGQAYQGQGGGEDVPGALTLRSVDGIAPIDPQTRTISASVVTAPYGVVLSNVLRDAELYADNTRGAALRGIFGRGGWICRNGADAIRKSGFVPLPQIACGSVTHS